MQTPNGPDPAVCASCGTNWGAQLPLVGDLPLCPACREKTMNWPYPSWLKFALVLMLVLLAFSLVWGAPYFRAGKALAQGERLVMAKQYREAAPLLDHAFTIAPTCDKCFLLLVKAQLLSGDASAAGTLLTKNRGRRMENSPLLIEVNSITRRVDGALVKYDEARKLSEENQTEPAAKAMREAATLYPEAAGLRINADMLEAGVAFEQKDYDAFFRLTKGAYDQAPDQSGMPEALASGFAAKYAVTGDPEFRARAEEMLERGYQLAKTDEDKASHNEYAERIRYRLESRVIIDKIEYDRRFRQKQAERNK